MKGMVLMENISIAAVKTVILALSSLFFLSPIFAQEQTHVTIQLTDGGSAHIVLESKNPSKIEELRSIIHEPSIKTIYAEKLSSVFRDLENLNIHIVADSVVIEFDSSLAEKNDVWKTNAVDFTGVLATPSTLTIQLPKNTKLVSASPPPAEITGATLTGHSVDYLPKITYKESNSSIRLFLLLAGVIIALALLGKKFIR